MKLEDLSNIQLLNLYTNEVQLTESGLKSKNNQYSVNELYWELIKRMTKDQNDNRN